MQKFQTKKRQNPPKIAQKEAAPTPTRWGRPRGHVAGGSDGRGRPGVTLVPASWALPMHAGGAGAAAAGPSYLASSRRGAPLGRVAEIGQLGGERDQIPRSQIRLF